MSTPFTPALSIDPAMRSGAVCLNGRRLDIEHVALNVAYYGSVDTYCDHYGLDPVSDRRAILVACAYWTLNTRRRAKRYRAIVTAWREWAEQTWMWITDELGTQHDPPHVEFDR